MTERAMIGNGSAGDEVTALQQGLASLGFDPGAVDGIFGPQTEAAVQAFQTAKGLTADGVVGPDTWAAFDAALAPPPAPEPAPAPTEVAPAAVTPEPTPAPAEPAPKLTETASAIADATGVTVSDGPSRDPSGIGGVLDALKEKASEAEAQAQAAREGNLGAL